MMLISPCPTVSSWRPAVSKRRLTIVASSKPDEHLSRSVEAAAAATFVAPWLESVTSRFAERVTPRRPETSCAVSNSNSLKHKLVEMKSYQMFVSALAHRAFLRDDWLDVTSRPFVQGPVDALLENDYFSHLLAADRELREDVDAIIHSLDYALCKHGGLPWLVSIVSALDHFPGIYQLIEVADRSALRNGVAAEVEVEVNRHFKHSSITDIHREVRMIKQLLSPLVLDTLMHFATTCITPDFLLWVAAMVDEAVTERDLLTTLSRDSDSA